MSAKKLYLRSFGCQMNDYDSNRIVDLLGEAMQLEKTEDLNEADVVVLNTCSIRERRRFSPIWAAFERLNGIVRT